MTHIDLKYSKHHKIIFVLSVFVILFIGSVTFNHHNKTKDSSQLVMHTYEVGLKLEELFSQVKDSEINIRGFLIAKDSSYLSLYQSSKVGIKAYISQLKNLTSDSKTQQSNLQDIIEIIDKRNENIANYLATGTTYTGVNDIYFMYRFKENNKLLVKIRKSINLMVNVEKDNLMYRNQKYTSYTYLTPILTLGILLLTLLFLVLTYIKINKDIEILRKANVKLSKAQFLSDQAEILSDFGTWDWDLDSKIITYSDNLYRILGFERDTFDKNKKFSDFVHLDDKEALEATIKNLLLGVELSNYNFRVVDNQGNIKHLRATGRIFENELAGRTMLGLTEDVTYEYNYNQLLKANLDDLMQINNELKISEESSKQAEIIGEYGSWRLDLKTAEFSYSDNKFRLLGVEPQSFDPNIDALLGYVHPEDREHVRKSKEDGIANKSIHELNYRVIRSDGSIRQFKTVARAYTDLQGNESMIGTTQDITEEYNKTVELRERNKELEQNIKEISEFNHVASHDLQEPLRKIETFISRINEKEKENLSDFGKDYINRVSKASSRMRKLINDLLQYSRTSRTEKNYENIDLNLIINQSITELSQVIEANKAVINFAKLPEIAAIDFQMQQLFTNLIGNAIKYSKADVSPIINIGYQKVTAVDEELLHLNTSKNYHKITISDNGIGFEQENAEKIFQLFNRLHGKTEYGGTGVGLAICKKIMENHNGYIFAKSTLNVGSSFIIYLPI